MMEPRQSDIHWRSLLLLTLLAAVIRFGALDRPAIWGDEAASWRRITGTYQQLVDELRSAGFQPAHYVLTWWIRDGFPYRFERQLESQEDANAAARTPGLRGQGPRGARPAEFARREVIVPTARLVDGGIEPSPFVMRFLPALCGTLLVPAMYFLAGQLVARRTALLVALFTCLSAYQLGYSRDAKMYAQLWCFATIHVACLLWWLKAYRRPGRGETRRVAPEFPKQAELGEGVAGVLSGQHVGHIARAFNAESTLGEAAPPRLVPRVTRLDALLRWACWVTSGLAMIAFHAVGIGIVGIEVLILLATAPQRMGLACRSIVAIASPALYVLDSAREKRTQREAARARLVADEDPLDYLERLNAQDEAPYAAAPPRERRRTRLTFRAAHFAPPPGPTPGERLRERLNAFAIPPIVGFILGAAAVLGLWSSYRDFTRFYDRVTDTDSAVKFDVDDSGISWVEPYNRGRTGASLFLENASAYLLSWEWPRRETQAITDPRTLDVLSKTTAALLIAAGVGLVPWRQAWSRLWRRRRPRRPRPRWRGDEPTLASISQPPLTAAADDRLRGPMPITAMLIVAAWLLVPAYGFYTASGAWKPDGSRTRAVTPTQAIVNAFYPAAYNDEAKSLAGAISVDAANANAANESWPGLRDRLARQSWGELFIVRGIDFSQPRWPWLWPAVGAGAIVLAFSRRASWRQRLTWLAWGGGAIALLWLLLLVTYVATPVQARHVWMPRYLGFVWPAFAIALCVLIRRLPFAPLRWTVVAVLLVANVANFAARLRFGEPPTDRIAADLARASRTPSLACFAIERSGTFQMGSPGTGRIFSLPDSYYFANAIDWRPSPREALAAVHGRLGQIARRVGTAADVAKRLKNDPAIGEFVLWAELPRDAAEGTLDRDLNAALGDAWRPAGPAERVVVYEHWTWSKMYVLERHRWTRQPPTTAPTSAPTPAAPAAPTAQAAASTRPIAPASRHASRPASTTRSSTAANRPN